MHYILLKGSDDQSRVTVSQELKRLRKRVKELEQQLEIFKLSNETLQQDNLDLSYDKVDLAYEYAQEMVKNWEEEYEEEIAELQKLLEEKEKGNQFLKKMYLSEKQKNDNYHTEKYGLDKPVEELRKIKLNPKEKEIYYKGFDNCERQFASHIAELQQQLKSQPAEIIDEIIRFCEERKGQIHYTWAMDYYTLKEKLDQMKNDTVEKVEKEK